MTGLESFDTIATFLLSFFMGLPLRIEYPGDLYHMTSRGNEKKIPYLNDALTYAEQDIKDRWEWYKEKFKKGLRK